MVQALLFRCTMKRLAWFVAAGVVAISSLAHAEPTSVHLNVGATAGHDPVMGHTGIVVGADRTLSSNWLYHVQFAWGLTDSPMAVESGTFSSARAGIEARPCVTEAVCVIAGVDAGFVAEYYTPQSHSWFGRASKPNEGFIAAPHILLDLGTNQWRFRPGLEATKSYNTDLDGVAATATVAYRW